MRSLTNNSLASVVMLFSILFSASTALGQTASFTYQGRLTDGGTPANGNYDLQFALWDSQTSGNQIGNTQTINSVVVSAGVFTVSLDFGANAFPGASRFLEISARLSGSGSFTLLSPRQPITSTPYAVRSATATNADAAGNATNASQLGGVAASQYVQTNDSRLSDSRPPTAGSSNYIQNTTLAQTASMNIMGTATIGDAISAGVPSNAQLSVRGGAVGGIRGESITSVGVYGIGQIGVRATGTSFFSGNTTPLPPNVGSGVAIGYLGGAGPNQGGFIFAYTYLNLDIPQNLILNHPGGNVGIGTTTPAQTLHVAGRARISSIPTEPAGAHVCFNVDGDLLNCGASSLRLKANVKPFDGGLDIIRRLRPISFDWKDGRGHDIGLGAEDVAKVAPSLTFNNDKGEVAGVKYEKLNLLLINAVQEQQTQIQQQRELIERQQALAVRQQQQLNALKKLACRSHRRARVCR
jgi:Chaperone of endosialidase